MSLELFNKTNRVKELPKYNYNGKLKLGPQGTFPIQDYMIAFYRPFERVGVIIRRSAVITEDVEPEVKKILEEPVIEEIKTDEIQTDGVAPDVVESEVKIMEEVGDPKEVSTETATQVDHDERKVYTEAELNEMKMDDLKTMLTDLGIDPQSVKYKKSEYVKTILEAQK